MANSHARKYFLRPDDATVLSDGRLMWSRWDHAPGRNGIHLYTANPDGTAVQLLYGANSHATGTNAQTIQFVKARELPDGRILALIRPFSGTDFGGDLTIIDTKTYVETFRSTDKANFFRDVTSGDPNLYQDTAFSVINGDTLSTVQISVNADGNYFVTHYDRTLTKDGMEVRFTRFENSRVVRAVKLTLFKGPAKVN